VGSGTGLNTERDKPLSELHTTYGVILAPEAVVDCREGLGESWRRRLKKSIAEHLTSDPRGISKPSPWLWGIRAVRFRYGVLDVHIFYDVIGVNIEILSVRACPPEGPHSKLAENLDNTAFTEEIEVARESIRQGKGVGLEALE